MGKTKINWADYVINPIQDKIKGESGRGYHCTKCSPGCLNCYAETINNRFGNHLPFDGRKAEFELINSEILKPIKWRKPRNIFVQSMGDLFHEDVPDAFIFRVFEKICEGRGTHTFLILTKRHHRLLEWIELAKERRSGWFSPFSGQLDLWETYLGLTICNQQEVRDKLSIFLQVPGKKFLSIEPMLSEISLRWQTVSKEWYLKKMAEGGINEYDGLREIDAVILGGETGPGARPIRLEWIRKIRNECEAAGVPFFLKHISKKEGRILDGRTHDALPWYNNVRQTE